MQLASIAALSRNNVIGKDNTMPWRLKGDLAFFREKTMGKLVIVGRTTYESIGRPLPGRRLAVLSRTPHPGPEVEGVRWFTGLDEILAHGAKEAEVMVAGGAQLYKLCMPLFEVQYLTEIDADVEGDTYYPEYNHDEWQEFERRPGPEGESLPYSFVTYRRRIL